MGILKKFVLHCTASIEGKELTKNDLAREHMGPAPQKNGTLIWNGKTFAKRADLPDIDFYGVPLRKVTGRGWNQYGYADVIHLDGRIENLVPYDGDGIIQPREISNGALGINGEARHIAYIGGLDKNLKPKDTRTVGQLVAMKNWVYDIIAKHPQIQGLGHNQVAAKACPCFDVPQYLISISINKANIYTK